MNSSRVLMLVHSQLVPPAQATPQELKTAPWRTEYFVRQALQAGNHQIEILGLDSQIEDLAPALEQFRPHVVFNLLEEFAGQSLLDHNVVSYMQLIPQKFTGCNPRGLMLCRDKALCKTILSYYQIPTPAFAVAPLHKVFKLPASLRFPVIVKSLIEEGSFGISQRSIVDNEKKLKERIEFIHENICTDALVEQYIDGRDVYVSLLGNQRVHVLPPLELSFAKQPVYPIASNKVKWDPQYQKKHDVQLKELQGLSAKQNRKIVEMSRQIYQHLGLSGYARLDLRLTTNNEIYFIEANPNPDLAYGEEFAMSAEKAGLSYSQLMQKIVDLGKAAA